MSKHRTKQRPTQTELILSLSLSLSLSTKFDVSWVISALFFMILWLNVSRNLPVWLLEQNPMYETKTKQKKIQSSCINPTRHKSITVEGSNWFSQKLWRWRPEGNNATEISELVSDTAAPATKNDAWLTPVQVINKMTFNSLILNLLIETIVT